MVNQCNITHIGLKWNFRQHFHEDWKLQPQTNVAPFKKGKTNTVSNCLAKNNIIDKHIKAGKTHIAAALCAKAAVDWLLKFQNANLMKTTDPTLCGGCISSSIGTSEAKERTLIEACIWAWIWPVSVSFSLFVLKSE